MKSNRQHTASQHVPDVDLLTSMIKQEKEALVSMFLANASISELAAQYKLIDELNIKINDTSRRSQAT